MSATRPGSHARDPSVPPPVDPELTRLSVRWTHGALRTVIAVWLIAGLVGASYDALSRYGHLTWILVWGGRGGASDEEAGVSRRLVGKTRASLDADTWRRVVIERAVRGPTTGLVSGTG